MQRKGRRGRSAALVLGLVFLATATALAVAPMKTFQPTEKIVAADVNANFKGLGDAVTSLEQKLRLKYRADSAASPKAPGDLSAHGLVFSTKDFEVGAAGVVQVSGTTGWELTAPRAGLYTVVVNLVTGTCTPSALLNVALEHNGKVVSETQTVGAGSVSLVTTLSVATGEKIRPLVTNNCSGGANYGAYSLGSFITVTEL